MRGLSPRVRGNRRLRPSPARPTWSIPACAGEPPRHLRQTDRHRVYPRVCGGTVMCPAYIRTGNGLSPRVRGNQSLLLLRNCSHGSIPACAGEPPARVHLFLPPWVYPRVCGGTPDSTSNPGHVVGLSPRVRGNHLLPSLHKNGRRSIPACAGEPTWSSRGASAFSVYPRVCGGTVCDALDLAAVWGLSPRVRGNLFGKGFDNGLDGSIPACAGEPSSLAATSFVASVYPRVCGGTPPTRRGIVHLMGLSPRVRGNRVRSP